METKRSIWGVICGGVVAAVVAVALAASSAQAAEAKKPPYVIGVSNFSLANAYRVQMINEIKYYAEQHPDLIKDLIVLNAGEDTNKQISDVQDLLSRGVDGILLAAGSRTAFNSVLSDAKQLAVPVATYNMLLAEETPDIVAQVVPPYKQWQHDVTAWMAKQLGGKGDVIALRGIAGTPIDVDEWAGAQEVLSQNPGIKVICSEYANWDYGTAKTAVLNCLAGHPKVDGILATGEAMMWAAAEVMANQGYDITKIPMIGVGAGNGTLKWWAKNPNVNGYIIADPTNVSVIGLQNLINVLQGKAGEKVQVPTTPVTKDDVAKYVQVDMPDNAWIVGAGLPLDLLKKQATRQ